MTAGAAAACLLLGIALTWREWRSDLPARTLRVTAGVVIAAMLAVLAWRPTRAVEGIASATINTSSPNGRAQASVEAVAMRLTPDAIVNLEGDGLNADALALLAGRELRWNDAGPRIGLASLSWPHRASIGERVAISGTLDVADSSLVVLLHPDGARDSVRTSGGFRFTVVPRAAGEWTWVIAALDRADTIGIQVVESSGPRVVLVEGRPSREGASIAALLTAQDGGLLQRTLLTADDERVTRHGDAPTGVRLGPDMLRSVDAVVLGPGGLAMLTAAEHADLLDAVRTGLGVIHLVDSTLPISPLQPFIVRPNNDERVRIVVDSVKTSRIPIPVAPVMLSDGTAIMRATNGAPLAWQARLGRGVIIGTRVTSPSRLGLGGERDLEEAWWAALLGAAFRPPAAEWRVSDAALGRVDQPLIIERIGESADSVTLGGTGVATVRIAMPRTADSLRRRTIVWPSASGWIWVTDGTDTLRVAISDRDAFPTLDRGERKRATRQAVAHRVAARPAERVAAREAIPLWWAWAALIAGLTVLWTRRNVRPG